MSYLYGIDIGGTKIALGALTPEGSVLAWSEIETRAAEGASTVIARLIDALHSIEQDGELLGIGIGATGPLDIERGHIQNLHTLPTFDDVDIVTPLAQEFFSDADSQTRVVLENDCDAAALGEAWLGAGRSARNMVYVTVGTGIGAGLVLEGKLYRGVGLTAGEIGHLTIEQNGVECYCGNRGCLEMLAAGPAIARAYQARRELAALPPIERSVSPTKTERSMRPRAGELVDVTAQDVIDAALAGEPLAREIVQQTAEYLGVGLANLVTLLAPDVIVMGGGVMEHFELFAPTIRATITQRVTLVPAQQVRLVRAALGKRAGVVGAGKAIMERLKIREARNEKRERRLETGDL